MMCYYLNVHFQDQRVNKGVEWSLFFLDGCCLFCVFRSARSAFLTTYNYCRHFNYILNCLMRIILPYILKVSQSCIYNYIIYYNKYRADFPWLFRCGIT